jgi:hypothetical protein
MRRGASCTEASLSAGPAPTSRTVCGEGVPGPHGVLVPVGVAECWRAIEVGDLTSANNSKNGISIEAKGSRAIEPTKVTACTMHHPLPAG